MQLFGPLLAMLFVLGNVLEIETLRKYPALASLTRVASVVLENGTNIPIPVRAIHYDPDIYPNPNEFRPVAFLGFGRMQVNVGLITLLLRFRLPPGSPDKLTVTRNNFRLVPSEGVRLHVDRLAKEE